MGVMVARAARACLEHRVLRCYRRCAPLVSPQKTGQLEFAIQGPAEYTDLNSHDLVQAFNVVRCRGMYWPTEMGLL